jgi:plasmid maintenance system antidote protein VapI
VGEWPGTRKAEFWIGLQADYELRVARQAKLKQIERESTAKIKRRMTLRVS